MATALCRRDPGLPSQKQGLPGEKFPEKALLLPERHLLRREKTTLLIQNQGFDKVGHGHEGSAHSSLQRQKHTGNKKGLEEEGRGSLCEILLGGFSDSFFSLKVWCLEINRDHSSSRTKNHGLGIPLSLSGLLSPPV